VGAAWFRHRQTRLMGYGVDCFLFQDSIHAIGMVRLRRRGIVGDFLRAKELGCDRSDQQVKSRCCRTARSPS
jgi:hypothetical protein